ncbi:hypothetical protein [Prochlorococcus sp. MIT 1300]|uniref:hypothetical protein n=1 Tax=Prochlorococcus sp. MIT 1300 TaxID=3096218 RepID=UPI002A75D519|nr:hypothetical protein [Prochlorococcus sp. MIT 1300]
MDNKKLAVKERLQLLVDSLDGAEKTNERLSNCKSSEEMLEILLEASSDLALELTREDLSQNPPIRDWIWWKNKEALVNLGDNNLRYQKDSSGKTRWDPWTIKFFKFLRIWR